MHQQKNRWTLSRKQSLRISKALLIICSMVCNHIHDLGVSLERRYGGEGEEGRRAVAHFSFLFLSFWVSSHFLWLTSYHSPFLNHFIMWVHKRFITQWIIYYIVKMWVSLPFYKKIHPVCHCLMFHCCNIFISTADECNHDHSSATRRLLLYLLHHLLILFAPLFPFSHIWTSSLSRLLTVCLHCIYSPVATLWSPVHIFRWHFLVLEYYNLPLIRPDTTYLQTSTIIPFPMQPFIFRYN